MVDGRLPVWGKIRLATEVARTYRRASGVLRRHDLPTALQLLRADSSGTSAPIADVRRTVSLPDGLRLGRAVSRTLVVLPADSRCLMRSVVLATMLASRGVAATLVIGVKPGEEFGAHAWVEFLGYPLLPTGDGQFTRLVEL
jgi:hypothetical protein